LDDGSSHDRTFAATLLLGATFFRLAAFDSVAKVLQAALGLSSDRSDDDVLSIAASNVGTFGIERALSAYGVLADALVAKSRQEQAVGLLESVLMLAPGCYRTSEWNRRLAPVIERVDGLITSRPIRVLADSLLEAGRSGDAVALLQRYLGIE